MGESSCSFFEVLHNIFYYDEEIYSFWCEVPVESILLMIDLLQVSNGSFASQPAPRIWNGKSNIARTAERKRQFMYLRHCTGFG